MSATGSGLGVSWHQLPEFRMAKVWGDGWEIFCQTPVVYVAIVLAEFLLGMGIARLLSLPLSPDAVHGARVFAFVIALACMFALAALGHALVALLVYQQFNHTPETLSANLRRVASRALPLLITGLLVSLAVCAGFALLVVPAFIAITAYSVAVATCAVEATNPAASLKRSAELTRGHRWPVFGLIISFGVVSALLDAIVRFIWTAVLGQPAPNGVLALLQTCVRLAPTAYLVVAWAVVYCHLREIKDSGSAIAVS